MSELQLGEQERREQEPDRRRRAYIAQLAGWAVAGLILVATVAGLTGSGPLSWASASGPLIEIEYERFTRRFGDSSLRLAVRAEPSDPGTVRLWLSAEYASKLNVQQVMPQPDSWTVARDGVVLTFPSADGTAKVDIQVSPDHIGLLRGEIGVPGRTPVGIWQFVYP